MPLLPASREAKTDEQDGMLTAHLFWRHNRSGHYMYVYQGTVLPLSCAPD